MTDGGCDDASVFLWAADGGTSWLASPAGSSANAATSRQRISISADGQYVARLRFETGEVFVWRNGATNPVVVAVGGGADRTMTRTLGLSDDGVVLVIGYPRFEQTTPVGTNVDVLSWNGTTYEWRDTFSVGFLQTEQIALAGDGKLLVLSDGQRLVAYRR